ncbi:DUF4031 domain-containing protein [Micromonospora sp. WMMD1082]|uniref:DUF4031 domain-containing protein n=1 Tax=Micromonospora sp. WMMD1082 TaxID=3016104 RepID=UPI0024171B26|nr:DUF4031 domain-containing protein [Micromonospora sp. WMMD1082]MDG4794228.1 DUF4031 domain-containing protein [Micromonospora sp. WMMD1082]
MIYVDRPAWPARGRLWSHLISDVSLAELHAFAETLGVPRRGFDRDHYDIPAERFAMAVWLGARVALSRDLVRLLRASGLRRPKHLSTPPPPSTVLRDLAVSVPDVRHMPDMSRQEVQDRGAGIRSGVEGG